MIPSEETTEVAVLPLLLILHIFIGATLAGSAIIVALTLGFTSLAPILIAGGLGFLVAFPVSWIVARKLSS